MRDDTLETELGPRQRRPIDRLLRPVQAFGQHKLAGAGLLLLATLIAIGWANSTASHSYHHLFESKASVSIGGRQLSYSLHHWINDGLMAIFFFLVGLEIKREVLVGELATLRKAALPAIAAFGGMVVPALIYAYFSRGGDTLRGWGIPMATDIAFALGVLSVVGSRVPSGLRVFLTAVAIVDDIGAVLVIAIFYTAQISWPPLIFGLGCIAGAALLNLLQVRNALAYVTVGVAAWLGFLQSGVHATISAILMAFAIPARTRIDGRDFEDRMSKLLAALKRLGLPTDKALNTSKQQQVFERMNQTIDEASAPLQNIEHALAGPVTFVVLPVFALANAGVELPSMQALSQSLTHPIVLGVCVGLVVGKTLGIFLATLLAVKLRVADLPERVRWIQVVGVAVLAGIGFTMALFIANLAFSAPAQIELAKLGIMLGSALSAIVGLALLRATGSPSTS